MPVEIKLTKGCVAVVDDCDGDLASLRWRAQCDPSGVVYARRDLRKHEQGFPRSVYLHRVVMSRMAGRSLLSEELVDHKDLDGRNCQRSNLRFASTSQNTTNRKEHRDSSSGYKGVSWNKNAGKWAAEITINGEKVWLGYHDTAEAAHKRYCEEAVVLHGEFTNTGGRK
jgi:hypothetical protein